MVTQRDGPPTLQKGCACISFSFLFWTQATSWGPPRATPWVLTVAACVVGDARAAQQCEACLTPAAVPAGAFAAQAALITPAEGNRFILLRGKGPRRCMHPSRSPPTLLPALQL